MLLPLVLAGAALVALSKKKDGFKIGQQKMRRVRRSRARLRPAISRPPTGYAAAVKSRIV